MGGFITELEVVANKRLIITSYGQEVYDYCLTQAKPNETFLSVLVRFGIL